MQTFLNRMIDKTWANIRSKMQQAKANGHPHSAEKVFSYHVPPGCSANKDYQGRHKTSCHDFDANLRQVTGTWCWQDPPVRQCVVPWAEIVMDILERFGLEPLPYLTWSPRWSLCALDSFPKMKSQSAEQKSWHARELDCMQEKCQATGSATRKKENKHEDHGNARNIYDNKLS